MRFFAAIVVLASLALAQSKPKSIKIVSIQQVATKDAETGRVWDSLVMEYETSLPRSDTDGLRREIDEIWSWLKKDAEHRKLSDAMIEVTWPREKAESTYFVFKKQPNGSWKYSGPFTR